MRGRRDGDGVEKILVRLKARTWLVRTRVWPVRLLQTDVRICTIHDTTNMNTLIATSSEETLYQIRLILSLLLRIKNVVVVLREQSDQSEAFTSLPGTS